MAAPIPSTEPASLVAGDTISWTKSFSDYAIADGYALSYALRYENGAGVLNITASSSTTEFTVTIPGASSSLMTPGNWRWASYVTLAGARTSISSGLLIVQPNLATIDSTVDLRSPAKLAYDNALAAWQSVKLGQTVMLNGRTYTQHNLDALTRFVQVCKSDYEAELQAEKFAQTGINPRRIGVRFTRV